MVFVWSFRSGSGVGDPEMSPDLDVFGWLGISLILAFIATIMMTKRYPLADEREIFVERLIVSCLCFLAAMSSMASLRDE